MYTWMYKNYLLHHHINLHCLIHVAVVIHHPCQSVHLYVEMCVESDTIMIQARTGGGEEGWGSTNPGPWPLFRVTMVSN